MGSVFHSHFGDCLIYFSANQKKLALDYLVGCHFPRHSANPQKCLRFADRYDDWQTSDLIEHLAVREEVMKNVGSAYGTVFYI